MRDAAETLAMLTLWFNGDEREALRFMLDHAGITISVAEGPILARLVADRASAASMRKNPSDANVKRLAKVFGVSNRVIRRAARRASNDLAPVGEEDKPMYYRALRRPAHLRWVTRV